MTTPSDLKVARELYSRLPHVWTEQEAIKLFADTISTARQEGYAQGLEQVAPESVESGARAVSLREKVAMAIYANAAQQRLDSKWEHLSEAYRDEWRADADNAIKAVRDWEAQEMRRQRPGEWRPIETAPKDGTAIWLLCDGRPYIGYCDPADPPLRAKDTWFLKSSFRRREEGMRSDDIFGCYAFDVNPTAWQELPTPPDGGDRG